MRLNQAGKQLAPFLSIFEICFSPNNVVTLGVPTVVKAWLRFSVRASVSGKIWRPLRKSSAIFRFRRRSCTRFYFTGAPRLFFELCPCFVAGMWLSEHLRSGASFCVTRARMDKFLFAWQAWRLLRVAKTRGLGRNERCAFGGHFCVLPQPSRPFVPDRSRRGLVLIFMVSDSSLCGAVLILRLLAQPSQHLLPVLLRYLSLSLCTLGLSDRSCFCVVLISIIKEILCLDLTQRILEIL